MLSAVDDIVIIKATHAKRPRILLSNGEFSCWMNLSALRLRIPRTGAILDGSVFNLLMRRHGQLESKASVMGGIWRI